MVQLLALVALLGVTVAELVLVRRLLELLSQQREEERMDIILGVIAAMAIGTLIIGGALVILIDAWTGN